MNFEPSYRSSALAGVWLGICLSVLGLSDKEFDGDLRALVTAAAVLLPLKFLVFGSGKALTIEASCSRAERDGFLNSCKRLAACFFVACAVSALSSLVHFAIT